MLDPIEQQLPNTGAVSISDGEQRITVQLNAQLSKAYQQQLEQKQQQLQQAATQARALHSIANTQQTARRFLNKLYGK